MATIGLPDSVAGPTTSLSVTTDVSCNPFEPKIPMRAAGRSTSRLSDAWLSEPGEASVRRFASLKLPLTRTANAAPIEQGRIELTLLAAGEEHVFAAGLDAEPALRSERREHFAAGVEGVVPGAAGAERRANRGIDRGEERRVADIGRRCDTRDVDDLVWRRRIVGRDRDLRRLRPGRARVEANRHDGAGARRDAHREVQHLRDLEIEGRRRGDRRHRQRARSAVVDRDREIAVGRRIRAQLAEVAGVGDHGHRFWRADVGLHGDVDREVRRIVTRDRERRVHGAGTRRREGDLEREARTGTHAEREAPGRRHHTEGRRGRRDRKDRQRSAAGIADVERRRLHGHAAGVGEDQRAGDLNLRWDRERGIAKENRVELGRRPACRLARVDAVERVAERSQAFVVAPQESARGAGQAGGVHALQDLIVPGRAVVERSRETMAELRDHAVVDEVDVEHADRAVGGDGDLGIRRMLGAVGDPRRRPRHALIGRARDEI